jgi:hypothetical protein
VFDGSHLCLNAYTTSSIAIVVHSVAYPWEAHTSMDS